MTNALASVFVVRASSTFPGSPKAQVPIGDPEDDEGGIGYDDDDEEEEDDEYDEDDEE